MKAEPSRRHLSPSTLITRHFGPLGSLLLAGLGIVCATPLHAAPGDGHWDRQFYLPGTLSRNAVLRFNGNLLCTAGYSVNSGQIATNTVVNFFDGTNWATVGDLSGSLVEVLDVAFLGTDLYVGGVFSSAGGLPAVGLAKWNGTSWSDVSGFTGVVQGLLAVGTNLYAAGRFTNAGGVLMTNIAKWDGANWSPLGSGLGILTPTVFQTAYSLAWQNGMLYAGGSFTNSGSTVLSNLARWDGTNWTSIGGGVSGSSLATGGLVDTLLFWGDDFYVGGQFNNAGGVPALNVAKWDGNGWSALGAGLKGPTTSTPVGALALYNSQLYASGNFTNAGGLTANSLGKWDGTAWSVPGVVNGSATRAVSNSGSLYICGDFNVANFNSPSNVIANHIIRWDGANWSAVSAKPGRGAQVLVQSVGLGSDGLYFGGLFNVVGTNTVAHISRWDGTNWFALGAGVTGTYLGNSSTVRAIKAWNGGVVVGGVFTTAGALTANNIAAWTGGNWSTLGYGMDALVFAIETTATNVYAGGTFTNAYDSPSVSHTVNRIARWSASGGWSALGSGVNSTVFTICAQGSVVYAGGSFTNAGGIAANRVAKWDGTNWFSLGTGSANGLDGTVRTILVDGTDVYVGGSFANAGGAAARTIARWDGTSWAPLGQGMFSTATAPATVYALAKIGAYLYASGVFTNAGGSVVTRNIARWDGAKWEALGSGVGNDLLPGASMVAGLAAVGNDLYLAGNFETAGKISSGYLARWNDQIDFTPLSVMRLSNPQFLPGGSFKATATATMDAAYVIEHSADFLNWNPVATNSLRTLDFTNPIPGAVLDAYRMREIP